ncbi:MAG: biotin--[acetyl-CoA-carboxylase] ligase [Bacteroidia bacterium]
MSRYFFPEIDSTQTFLREWAETAPLAHGTLVWALHQRAGYGRKGDRWFSTPGESLTYSFYLRENIEPFTLVIRAALALHDAIAPYASSSLHLKWPNDLWSTSHPIGKLAGLLGEIRWEGTSPRYAIIGIGVNVYQTAFPPHLSAVSLRQVGTPPPSLECLLERFEDAFGKWYTTEKAQVRAAFLQRAWKIGILYATPSPVPARLVSWDEEDYLHFATEKGKYRIHASLATELWRPHICA